MQNTTELADQIHQQALAAARCYQLVEGNLLKLLQQIEEQRIFLQHGHTSLFRYVERELRISEGVAYNLINVSRKALEIPELQILVASGKMTLSNARKIVPVITLQNKQEWLKKACELSYHRLQKEIVKVRPQEATPERATYVSADRVKLELGISEQDMLQLRHAQDLVAQKKQRAVTLEETLRATTGEYVHRHDPVQKAKRQKVKKGLNPSKPVDPLEAPQGSADREPIPAHLRHQVNLRDQGQCTYTHKNQKRCQQRRWLEIHHKIPVSQGGQNTLENLQTLCSAHHGWVHREQS